MKLLTWEGNLEIRNAARNKVRPARVEDVVRWITENEARDEVISRLVTDLAPEKRRVACFCQEEASGGKAF